MTLRKAEDTLIWRRKLWRARFGRSFGPDVRQTTKWMNACRSQWPCGLRSGFAAAWLLGLRVRIPLGAWMTVCCECLVLSSRGLCDGLDHSSRGVLPTAVRRCVWSRNLKNEEAMTRVRSQRHKKLQCITIATNTDKGPHINTTHAKHAFRKLFEYTL